MANKGEHIFKLHKLDDRQAYEMLLEVRARVNGTDTIYVAPVHGFNCAVDAYGEEKLAAGVYSLRELHWSGQYPENNQNVHVYFSRHGNAADDKPSPHFDNVRVVFSGEAHQWQNQLDVVSDVLAIVSSRDTPVASVDTGDGPSVLRELIMSTGAAHRSMMAELNKSVDAMVAKRAELEAQAIAVDEVREAAHKAAMQELANEREKLELQSSMAARRKITKNIHDLMEKTGKNKTTRYSSRLFGLSVFFAYMALGGAGTLGTYLTFQELNKPSPSYSTPASASGGGTQNTPQQTTGGTTATPAVTDTSAIPADQTMRWFMMLKFVLSTLVTIFGFTAAATWTRRYYDEELRSERENLAFAADVERASWVIEAIHEVKHEAKGELPKEWIDAVTKNLFATSQGSAAQLDDGALALRALMGFAGSAKIGPNGIEMDIGKKGTKAMSEAGE